MKTDKAKKHILYGKRKEKETLGVQNLEGLLLQISFAIMMVFMMAYFLFRNEAQREKVNQLLELERQKLVLARDAVELERSIRYGLDVLAPSNHTIIASIQILDNDMLTSNPVVSQAFLKAMQNGKSDLRSASLPRDTFIRDVLTKAELTPEAISMQSHTWLHNEADLAITWYENAIENLEAKAMSELQRHWLENPAEIDDPQTLAILKKLENATDEGRLLLVTELSNRLKTLAMERLSKIVVNKAQSHLTKP